MSRIIWGAPAERFYETGVDRGVLYVATNPGVAWNGLTSVSESPSGGEPKPAYIDGVKFRNIASSEEFEATIEAFSAPAEFATCEGRTSIQNGLMAMQQPRRAFSFAYRTMIGSATTDGATEYKIHLVYNALSGPAQRSHNTLSGSAEAQTMSWGITTLPPSLTGYKPTAHFVIDSRYTPKGLLAHIEDILYGTEVLTPRIPPVSELVALFQSEGPVIETNYVSNPNFRYAPTTLEVRRNLALNPRAASAVSSFLNNNAYWTTTKNVAVPAPHPDGILTCAKVEVVAAASAGSSLISQYSADGLANSAVARGAGVWIYTTTPANANVHMSGNQAGTSLITSVPANTWTFCKTKDGASGYLMVMVSRVSGNTTNGDLSYITGVVVESSNRVPFSFFDGSSPAADGLTYSWIGAADASESAATGYAISATSVSTDPAKPGKVWRASTQGGAYLIHRGGAYTLFNLPQGSPLTVGPDNRVITYAFDVTSDVDCSIVHWGEFGASSPSRVIRTTELIAGVPQRVVETVVDPMVPPTNGNIYVSIGIHPPVLSSSLPYVRLLVENSYIELGTTEGNYFDGNTPDFEGNFFSWQGTPDVSRSERNSWHLL